MSLPLRPPGTYGQNDPGDPAYFLLVQGKEKEALGIDPRKRDYEVGFNEFCYICKDPEFALMGLPLCRTCPHCNAHVAADDLDCDNGHGIDPNTNGDGVTVYEKDANNQWNEVASYAKWK